MGFLGFILFGVCSASWIWTLCLLPNMESFHLLFLQKVSLFYFLSPCPFETLMIWMLAILLLSYRSLSLCLSFVNIFFPLLLKLAELYCSVCPQVLWYYPLSSLLYYWAHLTSFFVILFFSSIISTWNFYSFCFIAFIS